MLDIGGISFKFNEKTLGFSKELLWKEPKKARWKEPKKKDGKNPAKQMEMILYFFF